MIRDYTGLDFDRIEELNVLIFDFYVREAVVFNCQQTETGQEYLEKCWRAEQTEPDRANLRKYFGKRG